MVGGTKEGVPLPPTPTSPHLAPCPDSQQLLGVTCQEPGNTRLHCLHCPCTSWLSPPVHDLWLSAGLMFAGSHGEQSSVSSMDWSWKVRTTEGRGNPPQTHYAWLKGGLGGVCVDGEPQLPFGPASWLPQGLRVPVACSPSPPPWDRGTHSPAQHSPPRAACLSTHQLDWSRSGMSPCIRPWPPPTWLPAS